MIDAHHHLWDPDLGYSWLDAPELTAIRRPFTADDLRAELGAHGVSRTVLVEGGCCRAGEVPRHLAIAAATPEIAGVVAWADLTDPHLATTLAGYRTLPGADKLVGIRDQVQGRADADFLDTAEAHAGLAAIAASGLAFDLVVRVDQLPAAARAAAAHPDLRFVLDHLGKPRISAGAAGLAEWRTAIAPLAACGNATAKLSGLVTEADWGRWSVADLRPYVAAAIEAFGADRLMFGSDWPVCTTAASYGQVLTALRAALPTETTDTEREAIFGTTARTTYRLEA
ncbi:amidohydrolase [Actinocatenispora thailandica]|uniref:Amidohydrolase n=1 Tax=Actinocatenispora thailandica TaxID=227318 RepID=A0A7R7HWW4_9ACTN|nr:amidohydrolase family protein [Actinocatenispora thailandica]BCJ34508.1 amidohydrolase [Actinocatenispora thailandica]